MRGVWFSLVLILAFVLAAPAGAVVPKGANAAMRFIDNLSQTAITTLTEKNIPEAERQRRFKVLLNQNFDVPYLGRFSLGRYWRQATTEQQQEYLRLFEGVITNTYANRFAQYNGQTVEVLNNQAEVDSILVNTKLVQPDGSEPVFIDWRIRADGSSFKIIDVIVEGVSMSITQRSEYGSVIERAGGDIEALLKILRKKVT
jgi:phospholipid transport system substrate-binding protein